MTALWDKDLPPLWLPQIPSCNSSRSSFDALGWMQSRYGLEKECLYNFWSLDNQKRGVFLRILSASNLSNGKMSSLRNKTMGFIQLGPTLTWWTWAAFPLTSVGLHKSSTSMTRGNLYAKEVASVVKESTCVFSLLGMCSRLNDLNFDCRSLTWLKYPCIFSSLASSSPPTWPTTSLEYEKILLLFPPPFEPWTFPLAESHIQPHCLWPRSPTLMISQWWASRTRSELALLQIPFGLRLQCTTSSVTVLVRRLTQPICHPCGVPEFHSCMRF